MLDGAGVSTIFTIRFGIEVLEISMDMDHTTMLFGQIITTEAFGIMDSMVDFMDTITFTETVSMAITDITLIAIEEETIEAILLETRLADHTPLEALHNPLLPEAEATRPEALQAPATELTPLDLAALAAAEAIRHVHLLPVTEATHQEAVLAAAEAIPQEVLQVVAEVTPQDPQVVEALVEDLTEDVKQNIPFYEKYNLYST